MATLAGKRVALLVAEGSEQAELTVVRTVLSEAGASPEVVSTKKQEVRLWRNVDWGAEIPVDRPVVESSADDFDALIVPGGVIGADRLRADRQAVKLVRDFLDQDKPVGAMGHAVWMLVEAQALGGKLATSIESIRSDVLHAGATWVDDPAVQDGPIITGRHQHDLPDFMAAVVEHIARA